MGKSIAPKGGEDRIYTPPELAQQIVDHFKPSGSMLEPCYGKGAFFNAMQLYSRHPIHFSEIDMGYDFLDINPREFHFDWIITNPPWSLFRKFLLKSMEVADNIVFLANLNVWCSKCRIREIKENGFGAKEALLVPTPPAPWRQTGFQLAATHIQKGYTGPLYFSGL